mmetsp:Transcript_707/g.1853  ORF Transcript_707/g.1853 Transcript_707/m.1853 type:complete len:279 (-) Transcript_707:1621-2457(-)
MSNSSNATRSSADASGCDTFTSCDSCAQESSCAWCAETRSCRRNDDACCLDKWTGECPEAELSCYSSTSQGTCSVCLSDARVSCQWCTVSDQDSGDCVDGGGFCAFASTSRTGRSLTCTGSARTDTCPSDRQDSTTYELPIDIRNVLIAVVVVSTLLCLCAPRIARRWRDRRILRVTGRNRARERQRDRQEAVLRVVVVEARTTSIRALPELRIGPDGKLGECTICLEDYNLGDVLVHLPCLHSFHTQCAGRWLLEPSSQGRCPACRAFIVDASDLGL